VLESWSSVPPSAPLPIRIRACAPSGPAPIRTLSTARAAATAAVLAGADAPPVAAMGSGRNHPAIAAAEAPSCPSPSAMPIRLRSSAPRKLRPGRGRPLFDASSPTARASSFEPVPVGDAAGESLTCMPPHRSERRRVS
jgi:hypothetical protein